MRLDQLKSEHLRRMAEPEDLRLLRQQAERIELERQRASKALFERMEKQRLRSVIRNAGEEPCC